jgi:hypothetical protein
MGAASFPEVRHRTLFGKRDELFEGDMEAGFVPDSRLGAEVPGPRPSFLKRLVGYKMKIPITTYRCTACGHLESVAEG